MNVLLAGALGIVGQPLSRILVARGHRVFGMTQSADRSQRLWSAGSIPVIIDVLDTTAVDRALAVIRPAVVIELLTELPRASDPSDLPGALERNARIQRIGTANLVSAAMKAGTSRLITQSVAWAYAPRDGLLTEDCPLDLDADGLRAITVDGVASLEDATLKSTGLGGCVLRFGVLHGPGTGSFPNGDSGGAKLHVEAAAWAMVLALERNAAGIFNVAEDGTAVVSEKARRILGWDPAMRLATETDATEPGFVRSRVSEDQAGPFAAMPSLRGSQ